MKNAPDHMEILMEYLSCFLDDDCNGLIDEVHLTANIESTDHDVEIVQFFERKKSDFLKAFTPAFARQFLVVFLQMPKSAQKKVAKSMFIDYLLDISLEDTFFHRTILVSFCAVMTVKFLIYRIYKFYITW